MKWFEITVATTEQGLDAVCGRLDMLGIDQVMIEQGRGAVCALLDETRQYWDYADPDEIAAESGPCVKAYIEDTADAEERVETVRESFARLRREDVGIDLGSLAVTVRTAADEDWENNWKLYYKPVRIGERLLVCPSWEEEEADGRVKLTVDPGMAFGTGTHQTTRMCLGLLEKTVRGGESVADLGCGSGILSIAALLLGANDAEAVDIDPVAEHVVSDNALLNGIDKASLTVHIGNVLTDDGLKTGLLERQYDIVCANIVASVVIACMPLVKRLLKPGGLLIASGIIRDRLSEVRAAVESEGLGLVETLTKDDWAAMLVRKPMEDS